MRLGSNYLNRPADLKYLIGPILIKSEEQQDAFYELFDKYIAEIQAPLPIPPPPIPWYQQIPKGLYYLFGAISLGMAIWMVLEWRKTPKVEFQLETPVIIGDTIIAINSSAHIGEKEMQWVLSDAARKEERKDTLEADEDWAHIFKSAGSNPTKILQLALLDASSDITYSYELAFTVECEAKYKPQTTTNNWQDTLQVNTPIAFQLGNTEPAFTYQWEVNGAKINNRTSQLDTAFNKQGFYSIKVVVSHPTDGFCQQVVAHRVVVREKREIAPLEQKPLAKIPSVDRAQFTSDYWWWLTLLGLLPLLALAYRWWVHRKKQRGKKEPTKELKQIFDAPDKPPYFIPFRSQTHHIQAGKNLYEFATTLRRRQEGLRKELNVEKSLKATIEKGGFPHLKVERTTQPSEYLFLIDDQYRDSIQSRLFEYLVAFLQSKDVYAERYFYSDEPFSIWQKKDRESLNLKQLYGLFPYHRLVVMGDAHRWLSQRGTDAKSLKKAYTQWIARWKQKTILSPIPPVSWTYKESGIHNWLPLYPADSDGIEQAFDALQETEEERVINFKRWRQDQREGREKEPDVNYKNWRKKKEIKAYLAAYPSLWKWLCALSVHPVISWELTLAIGHALAAEGVAVTFDNLLLLSRIPWLQKGSFPPKLRLQLLDELSPEIEQIARRTVQTELKAVEELTHNSFVNFEVQAGLAVQNFLLASDNKEYQEAIRAFTAGNKPAIGKHRYKELDQQIKKYQSAKGLTATGVQAFLEETKGKGEEKRTTSNNPCLKWIIGITVLWLSLIGGSWAINEQDILYQWSFAEASATTNLEITKKDDQIVEAEKEEAFFGLVKKISLPTSAMAKRNNEAVELYETAGVKDSVRTLLELAKEGIGTTEEVQIVANNLLLFSYNRGVENYVDYFSELELDTTFLTDAQTDFMEARTADVDSSFYEAWHGEGLTHWYLNDTTKARSIYEQLDRVYLDTLTTRPNLKTIIEARDTSAIPNDKDPLLPAIIARNIEGECRKITNVNYNLSLRSSRLNQRELRQENGGISNNQNILRRIPKEAEVQLLDSLDNFYAVRYQNETGWIVKLNNGKITLRSCALSVEPIKDQDEDGIPDAEDNCPEERGSIENNGCPIFYVNGVKYALSKFEDTPLDIAKKYNVSTNDLLNFNEWIKSETQSLRGEQRVFIEERKRDYAGPETFHIVQSGERMEDIANRYGVALAALYEKNRMPIKSEPAEGEKIKLDEGIADKRPALRFDPLVDTDEDGIPDKEDSCPKEFGPKENNGCPLVAISTFTDPRDKQTYQLVTLANQTWMAENLNYQTQDSWCYLELEALCQKAGRLYTWEAAKKACPQGWHLPTDEEWKELLEQQGGYREFTEKKNIGDPRKSYDILTQGIESDFVALLGGHREVNGEYIKIGLQGTYWTTTENTNGKVWKYYFASQEREAGRSNYDKNAALSVRCLKNKNNTIKEN